MLRQDQIQRLSDAAEYDIQVIEEEIAKLANGHPADVECRFNIDRCVDQLKMILSIQEFVDSVEDVSAYQAAVAAGEAKLAEPIWD